MDDEPDGAVSRAPELEDLVALCRALNREGVRYLLIGGFAVILHGFVRTTKDVDLLIDPSDTKVAALKRALASLPDNAAAEIRDADVRQYTVVRVADEIVVNLMASACGITYEEAMRHDVEHRDIDGVRVPLAGKRLLIRLKDTVRPSDQMDVGFLKLRLEAGD
jgi:predicted nucleotidyltransferase